MLRRTLALVTANVAVGAALVVGLAPAATAADTAPPVTVLATTLTYDDSQAGEFKSAVASAAAIWNAAAPNVRIVKATAGQRVNIRVIADNGWPRATLGPVRATGSATIWMGREAVNDGFNVVRIATHEMGHSLGLPDRRTGLCTDLMSGSSAPVSCANSQPSSAERAQVQRNYAGTAFTGFDGKTAGRVIVDTP